MDQFVVTSGPKIQAVTIVDGTPLSFEQITVSTAAVGLTIPPAATMAIFVTEGDVVRWRNDGTNPTATVGMPITPFQYTTVNNRDSLTNLKFIRDTNAAGDATLNVTYYKK